MPLSAIKNALITRDNAFDERIVGYANFSSFMRDIPSVEIYQAKNKTHWLGQLKRKAVKQGSLSELQPASTEVYEQLLRTMNWPFVPRSLIINIHDALLNTKPIEVSDLKENLFQLVSIKHKRKLMIGTTASDIKKGLATLYKAKLFEATVDKNDDKYWQYVGKDNYLSEINNAMTVRVKSACGKEHVAFDSKLLQPLLYPKG